MNLHTCSRDWSIQRVDHKDICISFFTKALFGPSFSFSNTKLSKISYRLSNLWLTANLSRVESAVNRFPSIPNSACLINNHAAICISQKTIRKTKKNSRVLRNFRASYILRQGMRNLTQWRVWACLTHHHKLVIVQNLLLWTTWVQSRKVRFLNYRTVLL